MPKLHWTTDVCLLRNVFTAGTFLVVLYLSRHPFESILASAVTRFLLMILWFGIECSPLPDVSRWFATLVGLEKAHGRSRGRYSARGYQTVSKHDKGDPGGTQGRKKE
mmetsp:Transcript_16582/g.38245  ORF Transcript_16582/g.38245 Transcript_16582/m.38245 type:complete len:108 (-) Transcript_16582:194-517(-)